MAAEPKDDLGHVENIDIDHSVTQDKNLGHFANQEEHEDSKLDAIRKYPWACFWCVYAATCVLLAAFENQAAGSILSIPEFRKDFGYAYESDGETAYTLSASWQGAFQGAPVASAVIGALGCGHVADALGRRMVIIICLVICFAAISMEFVATTNALFFGGKFLNGFSVGAVASVTVTYIGEVTPLALRGVFTCVIGLMYTLGPLIAAIIVNFTGDYDNRWAYRAVFCAQYGFAVICSALIFFMPESPWWLVSKNKQTKALQEFARLGYPADVARRRLAHIELTLEEIRAETEGVTYLECFRKSNFRRTCVSIAPLCIQIMSGVVFAASYSTYYAELAGYSTADAFKIQIAQQITSMIGNIMSWFLVDRFGRRDLTFWGLVVLTVILFLTGGLAVVGEKGNVSAIKGTVSFIIIYCWWYNVTIGATAYTVLAEVSTSRLRIKTIAIGLALQYCLSMMWSFVLPYLFNVDEANLGAKVTFIFGGFSLISLVYLWFCLPETAGRTYEELDEMFAKGIPAHKFKDYVPEAKIKGEAVKEAKVMDS